MRAHACAQAGAPAWLSGTGLLTTALRALPMACEYYATPLASACSMVASRPAHAQADAGAGAPPAAPGVAGSGAEHQQLWRPLLQPALVEGLWMRVQGQWRQLGLLGQAPAAAPGAVGPSPGPGAQGRAPSSPVFAAFVAAAGLPPAEHLACVHQRQVAAGDGAALPWLLHGHEGQQLRACLGSCLQLCGVPYGDELQAAVAALRCSPLWSGLRSVLAQSAAAAAGAGPASPAISMALVPLLAAAMPQAPPAVLRLLASCCVPLLLS